MSCCAISIKIILDIGMTVNERLYISGLMDKFENAVKDKNIDLLISILKEIELNDLAIEQLLIHFGL
jgi:hypothetical protein